MSKIEFKRFKYTIESIVDLIIIFWFLMECLPSIAEFIMNKMN